MSYMWSLSEFKNALCFMDIFDYFKLICCLYCSFFVQYLITFLSQKKHNCVTNWSYTPAQKYKLTFEKEHKK